MLLSLDYRHGIESLFPWVVQAAFDEGVGLPLEGRKVEEGSARFSEEVSVQERYRHVPIGAAVPDHVLALVLFDGAVFVGLGQSCSGSQEQA